jgi:outer membrane protein OmpA-like peptidoglycan-associated protein
MLFQNVTAQESTQKSNGGQLFLMGVVLETAVSTTNQQDDGILGDKSRIRIINLGPIINYSGLDYAPTVSADGKTLYYVSNRPGSKLGGSGKPSHDFFAAKKNDRLDTVFFQPFNIDTTTNLGNLGVNTSLNEGVASIAADRQTLYFTGCKRDDGLGDCDLYMTTIEGDKWGRPINLGPKVNSKYFDSQPSIAPDKSRIYFVSTRPGPNSDGQPKLDNFDIWYSDYDFDNDEWKESKNLTDLNTKSQDCSPFIAADNVTLFFSSKGLKPNIGGLDFYVTRNESESNEMKWTLPDNLGEPINTSDDEQFISLPASGDILYFSSKRTDLKHYQGDLDIFMAFVPSFFRAVNVVVKVVDECSGIDIPATITITNPITERIFLDSLTPSRNSIEMVVSNTDYGNPKDSLKFVDLKISAVNPKYGEITKVQRVTKPAKTKKIEETSEYADVIEVILTMGQRPVIGKEIEEATYVTKNKASKPEIANFNGLVMEQFQTWDLYPLLNYVFFDLGASNIDSRYKLFRDASQTNNFTDTTIAGGTLDKYYHLLNIYGYRMKKFPEAKLDIIGCNDGTTAEEKKPGLSKERATNVYNYLKDIWGIEEARLKLTFRDKPAVISNLKDSMGIVENRRVELISSEWEIMKPVFDKDPKTFPQPETMLFTMKNGIEDALIAKRRIEIKHGKDSWNVLHNVGITDAKAKWNWTNTDEEYPKDEQPFTAILYLTTTSGKECASDPITIPVMQVSTTKKKTDKANDSTIERYSLILFPFDRSDAGPLNERIMKDYVYERCQNNSYIEVIGHTDVVGLYEHNQKLSDRRSSTVYNGIMGYTKSKVGVISKRGVGEDEPLFDNTMPECRFYNRTVQVIIKTPISVNE